MEREILKMGLTWEEFLKLAAIISNLKKPIVNDEIGINEKNRLVAAAAINYKKFFNDLKYFEFMDEVRISSKIINRFVII